MKNPLHRDFTLHTFMQNVGAQAESCPGFVDTRQLKILKTVAKKWPATEEDL